MDEDFEMGLNEDLADTAAVMRRMGLYLQTAFTLHIEGKGLLVVQAYARGVDECGVVVESVEACCFSVTDRAPACAAAAATQMALGRLRAMLSGRTVAVAA